MNLEIIGHNSVDWDCLVHDRIQWESLFNAIKYNGVP
jgi:hypothetical protein